MTTMQISHALRELRPGEEWSFTGSDYSTIVWYTPSVTAPSLAEVEAKVNELYPS